MGCPMSDGDALDSRSSGRYARGVRNPRPEVLGRIRDEIASVAPVDGFPGAHDARQRADLLRTLEIL